MIKKRSRLWYLSYLLIHRDKTWKSIHVYESSDKQATTTLKHHHSRPAQPQSSAPLHVLEPLLSLIPRYHFDVHMHMHTHTHTHAYVESENESERERANNTRKNTNRSFQRLPIDRSFTLFHSRPTKSFRSSDSRVHGTLTRLRLYNWKGEEDDANVGERERERQPIRNLVFFPRRTINCLASISLSDFFVCQRPFREILLTRYANIFASVHRIYSLFFLFFVYAYGSTEKDVVEVDVGDACHWWLIAAVSAVWWILLARRRKN